MAVEHWTMCGIINFFGGDLTDQLRLVLGSLATDIVDDRMDGDVQTPNGRWYYPPRFAGPALKKIGEQHQNQDRITAYTTADATHGCRNTVFVTDAVRLALCSMRVFLEAAGPAITGDLVATSANLLGWLNAKYVCPPGAR